MFAEAADFSVNTSALVDMGFDYKDATAALAGVCVLLKCIDKRVRHATPILRPTLVGVIA